MITKMQIRKIAVAACAAVLTMSTLCACGDGSGTKQAAPPYGEAPDGFKGVFTMPFTAEDADAVLFQPGAVSAYGQNAGARPEIHIWYDNADSSTNVCMDFFELADEASKVRVQQKVKYVDELYLRIINTAKEFAGGDRYYLYTLTGQHLVDFENAANNTVTWGPAQPGLKPGDPNFYVRSIEKGVIEENGTKRSTSHPATYSTMSKGVLHQLYDADGMITPDAFSDQINVVFTDTADPDLTTTDLANLVAARLKDARTAGKDVTFQVVGIKVPFNGDVAYPGSDKSTMATYSMTGSVPPRTFYFLVSGPTAATEQYISNLVISLKGKVSFDAANENGFQPECLFVKNAAAEPAAEGETEEGSETEPAQAACRLRVIPDANAENKAKNNKAKSNKKDSGAEGTTGAEDAADTTTTQITAAESDYRTANFRIAEEEQMLQCFRGSDIGDLTNYAEKQQLNWKQYMSLVYLPTSGKQSYPAELLTQLFDADVTEIKDAKLYQASLIRNDGKGKDLSCTWLPVSKEDFNSIGEFVQLKNEVYLKFNKQAPQQTHTWMLEVDLMDKVTEDHSGMISEVFTEKYTVADQANNRMYTWMGRGDFGDIILSANDQKVREKYYVMIMLQNKPTDALTQKAAEKQGKTGSSKDASEADKKSDQKDADSADGE